MEKIKTFKEFLNENLMSRVVQHISKHDCAIISAFRSGPNCGEDKDDNGNLITYTLNENKARNKSLIIKLELLEYGISKINGVYIENYETDNAKEIKEDSYFVVNLHDRDNFITQIKSLGKEFEQDSIMYIPTKELTEDGKITTYLVSTNECPDGFPGKGKIGVVKRYRNIKINQISQFMSRLNNKPFYFTESLDEKLIDNMFRGNWMSGMAMQSMAKQHWTSFIKDFEN